MCGIIGFSSKKNYNYDKIKMLMFWNSVDRGLDATGIYTPKSGIIKDNVPVSKFMTSGKYTNKLKKDNLLVAHVRKRSVGMNTLDNAHPFKYGDVITVHNGTLSNHWALASKYKLDLKDYDTDSQILSSVININYQNNEDFKILSEYVGYAAILSYNEKTGILTACRDDHRPLYYGYINNDLYISSIEESLELIECEHITPFIENMIYSIKDGDVINIIPYPSKPVVIENKFNSIASTVNISDYVNHTTKERVIKFTNGKYNGISSYCIKPEYIIGYNLIYTGYTCKPNKYMQNILTSAAVTKGKSYLVRGVDTMFPKDRVKIIDDTGAIKSVSIDKLDISNFIPVKDNYIKINDRLTLDNSKKRVANKGDIVRVLNHTWLDNYVHVKNEITNISYLAPLINCEQISDKELDEYKEVIETHNSNLVKKSNTLPIVHSSFNQIKVIDDEPNEDDIIVEDEDVLYEEVDDLDDPYILITHFIYDMIEKLNKLKDKHSDKEIDKDMNEILTHVENSLDITYLESLF